ncbi:hypothetical protein OG223_34965 [Streptomyces sp. NBC_01478]|uniref:hypothetical protein n=1 Tax=Streptomyces sp. NBC_01478 TaxID=2903882 RepID=UPI002E34DC73|nr:hypothetical protein [Streptomyces sp. NBC_01478]
MSVNEVETTEARELLGRALEGVPVSPGGGTEAVFARARQVRMRRRAAVTGVVASVTAAGVAGGAGLLWGDGSKAVTAAQHPTRASEFKKLLPPGVGRLREVNLKHISDPDADWKRLDQALKNVKVLGRYDGTYAVYKGGGVGYITVQTLTDSRKNWQNPDPCSTYASALAMCTKVKLQTGDDIMALVNMHANHRDAGNTWGPELTAELYRNGYTILVNASTGFESKNQLGPRLKTPPLTMAQLRALVQLPQLMPKAKAPKD